MISEFLSLAKKIEQLADLAQSLRRENAELRMQAAAMALENAELSKRMAEAHVRVTALLDKIPVRAQDEEIA